jgi:hypothetical protein
MLKQKRYSPTTLDLVFSFGLPDVAGASTTQKANNALKIKKKRSILGKIIQESSTSG